MHPMSTQHRILEAYRRRLDLDEYTRIRELYKTHSIAEDARDVAGLLSTLTPDCVYELPQIGQQWAGHAGATRFYGELLGAFPDINFDLSNIVIGPQGVWEEADVTATWAAPWLGLPATGRRVEFVVQIFFPWDPAQGLFRGERVFVGDPAMFQPAA